MSLNIECGQDGRGIQILRIVVDVIDVCNKSCDYCHPLRGQWTSLWLEASHIRRLFEQAEAYGCLEVTLTGGEIGLHPQLDDILESTHLLHNTAATLITNGTVDIDRFASRLTRSKISRVCVSLDGPTAEIHKSARKGNDFGQVRHFLELLGNSELNVTVISVAHRNNYRSLLELSHYLVDNHLASQHHICAPSYSGAAKDNYPTLQLTTQDFHALQQMVDHDFVALLNRGLYVTFNSYWPATGNRSSVDAGRSLTLVQLTEQQKDVYLVVRPNGDVRLTSKAWGRETLGDAVVGKMFEDDLSRLFSLADDIYRKGQVRQLPRAIEALHKFHIGKGASRSRTNELLASSAAAESCLDLVPIHPLIDFELFESKLDSSTSTRLVHLLATEPGRLRLVQHSSKAVVAFDRKTGYIALLRQEEVPDLERGLAERAT